MALVSGDMADDIKAAMAVEEPNVFTGATSEHLDGWCKAIIDEITTYGSATYGTTASGHPISGLSASRMATAVDTNVTFYTTVTTFVTGFCTAIVNHIHSDADVTYTTPTGSPDPADDYWYGGTISGMNGLTLAGLVKTQMGYAATTDLLDAFCTAVVDYIEANAEVEEGVIS